jgi:hypothetical protein
VRTVYGDELSGINPFIVVPAIFFLIARNYFRGRFSAAPWERRPDCLPGVARERHGPARDSPNTRADR